MGDRSGNVGNDVAGMLTHRRSNTWKLSKQQAGKGRGDTVRLSMRFFEGYDLRRGKNPVSPKRCFASLCRLGGFGETRIGNVANPRSGSRMQQACKLSLRRKPLKWCKTTRMEHELRRDLQFRSVATHGSGR